jgi:hypothetical protein
MQTVTKQEIKDLGPCWPWVPAVIDQFEDDPSNGPDILAFVISIGHPEVVPWLMAGNTNLAAALVTDALADVNAPGIHARCALHFAAIYERVDVITWLRQHGANNSIGDADDLTPVDLANLTGNQAVIDAMNG